jgi:hypothetical protein
MLLEQERNEVVRFGRKLITSQLTTGSGATSVFITARRD